MSPTARKRGRKRCLARGVGISQYGRMRGGTSAEGSSHRALLAGTPVRPRSHKAGPRQSPDSSPGHLISQHPPLQPYHLLARPCMHLPRANARRGRLSGHGYFPRARGLIIPPLPRHPTPALTRHEWAPHSHPQAIRTSKQHTGRCMPYKTPSSPTSALRISVPHTVITAHVRGASLEPRLVNPSR